ncbi:MAG: hypothetical protein DI539_05345 [Flavobacterium psychrophilum]|nr:MAG: hypothetical protein DI539_05345 [Flavobacterium psychrophilum]
MKTLYILPVLLLIIGCKSASSDKPSGVFSATSENGLAVGTITFEGDVPRNDIYRFLYQPTSDDKKFIKKNEGKIEIKARDGKKRGFTGDFGEKKSYVFVIERAPGKYNFTQHTVLSGLGSMGNVNFSKLYGIPFEIKKGEITYLGELSYNDNALPGDPRIVVYDRYDRDLAELKKKYPNIDWKLASDKTPKSGNKGEGNIIDFR